jgi:hypothetical protein
MFVAYLLARNIRYEEDLVDQLFNCSEKRLARFLLLLAHFGKEGIPETVIPRISQETLAEMVGTTRSRGEPVQKAGVHSLRRRHKKAPCRSTARCLTSYSIPAGALNASVIGQHPAKPKSDSVFKTGSAVVVTQLSFVPSLSPTLLAGQPRSSSVLMLTLFAWVSSLPLERSAWPIVPSAPS